jgi:pimeloyl-ACP methyl ester carboxylesterase
MRIDHAHIGRLHVRYAERHGDRSRAPLLFLNGLGANIELAQPFIDALDALDGPTVVIFDVPGVGGSPTPPSPYRPASIAGAAGLLDHLGYAGPMLLGVSWAAPLPSSSPSSTGRAAAG